MKNLILALLMLLPVVTAAADFSKLQADKSSITFVSKQMGVPVEGRFKKFTARVHLNPAKPEAGKAHMEIDLASIDAGSKDADDEVKGKSWFNVAEFPKAVFDSHSVKALGDGKYEVTGKLEIKGKSGEMRAVFTLKQEKGALEITGSFPLKRLDYGIGSGLWSDTSVVADEVEIRFHLYIAS